MWHTNDGMGWWMVFAGSMWLLLLLLIVIAVLTIARPGSSRNEQQSLHDPLEIARRRYAQGEINREEFEQLRRDLADEA